MTLGRPQELINMECQLNEFYPTRKDNFAIQGSIYLLHLEDCGLLKGWALLGDASVALPPPKS